MPSDCPPPPNPPLLLADPDDDVVPATAVAGVADAIVSGDAHLIQIGEFRGIHIITPVAAGSRLVPSLGACLS